MNSLTRDIPGGAIRRSVIEQALRDRGLWRDRGSHLCPLPGHRRGQPGTLSVFESSSGVGGVRCHGQHADASTGDLLRVLGLLTDRPVRLPRRLSGSNGRGLRVSGRTGASEAGRSQARTADGPFPCDPDPCVAAGRPGTHDWSGVWRDCRDEQGRAIPLLLAWWPDRGWFVRWECYRCGGYRDQQLQLDALLEAVLFGEAEYHPLEQLMVPLARHYDWPGAGLAVVA